MRTNLRNNISTDVRALGELKTDISLLRAALDSLTVAVSVLQSINEVEENLFFKNTELVFPRDGINLREAKKSYEINLIKQALRRTGGHQSDAAKLLSVKLTTLNSIIRKHKIVC